MARFVPVAQVTDRRSDRTGHPQDRLSGLIRHSLGVVPVAGGVYRRRASATASGASHFMTVHTRLAAPLVELIRKAMTGNALPGEAEGLTPEAEQEAAEFLAQVGAKRKPGEIALAIHSLGGEAGNRRMRIAIVNDDMPFLVDSVANASPATN